MLSFELSLIFSEDSLLIFKFLRHSFSKSLKGECVSDCSHSDPLAHSACGKLGEEIDKPPRMIRVLLKDWRFLVWLRGRTWNRNGGRYWARRVHEIWKPLTKSWRTVHPVKEWLQQIPHHEGEMPELQEASERQFHVRAAQSHGFPVLRSSSLLAGWGCW